MILHFYEVQKKFFFQRNWNMRWQKASVSFLDFENVNYELYYTESEMQVHRLRMALQA